MPTAHREMPVKQLFGQDRCYQFGQMHLPGTSAGNGTPFRVRMPAVERRTQNAPGSRGQQMGRSILLPRRSI
ncbi:hypothetical protein PSPO01_15330 [Paraphaeosphaeria sporulosa]